MNNITYFNDTIDKADYDKVVADLALMTTYRDSVINDRNILRNRIDSFKSEIKQFVIDNLNGHVTNDDLRDLAESLDIPLTQDVTFTATVTFSVSAIAPIGADMDNVALDFTAALDYNGGELQGIDFDYAEVIIDDVEF